MPNDLGAYLALSLPFVLGYFVASWRQHRKEKKTPIWVTWVLGPCRNYDERESRVDPSHVPPGLA